MKLSLSARILQGAPAMSTVEFINLARETGFDMVELRADQLSCDSPPETVDQVRGALNAAGISVSMLVVGGSADVLSWVPVARAVGATNLRANGTADELNAAAEALPDDLRIVCQMHSGSAFENVADATAALAGMPCGRFGLMPEPANLLFAGDRWSTDLFAPLADRILGCNAQSIALDAASNAEVVMNDGRRVPYSRSDWPANTALDFPGFISALQATGYDDFINFIDPFHPDMSVHELAASTAAYAREVLSQ